MSYQLLAFYTGLFASVHCVAMCGPLMLSMPFSTEPLGVAVFQKVLYQVGRILMYGFLGLAIGFIGSGFNLLGLQQVLSTLTGSVLIVAGISYFIKTKSRTGTIFPNLLKRLYSILGKHFNKPYGSFLAGTVNGLLPCGMVYIALAQAVNLPEPQQSVKFMIIFGLGTLPLLFVTVITPLFFRKFRAPAQLVPTLFLVAGSILVLRGMNVDIPYVSHFIGSPSSAVCK
ncbi:MAG TPA: sulfite exporter TauE/SafE family protein [Pedobacter sp.]|jgi:hypothetical protein